MRLLVTALLVFWLSCSADCAPTTPYIQDVFLGKCYLQNPVGFDCAGLWQAFSAAASLNPATNASTEWNTFFDLASFVSPPNLALFWSGSKAFSAFLSTGGRFTTLEETPVGYVLNGLSWCGNGSNQFDFSNSCGYLHSDTYYGMEPIWKQASFEFASHVSGGITMLLNPAFTTYNNQSVYRAYRPTSILATVELGAMNADAITSVQVLVLANVTVPTERCGSGSLVDLMNDLRAKFGPSTAINCVDDSQQIVDIICSDDRDTSAECIASRFTHYNIIADQTVFCKTGEAFAIVAIIVIVILLFVVAGGVTFFVLHRKKRMQSTSS